MAKWQGKRAFHFVRCAQENYQSGIMEDDFDFDDVPSFSTGASFLDANAQAHHKPLSAFGDLTDNARDADATRLTIDVELRADDESMLIMSLTDNGRGMSEERIRNGFGGIGHSDKSDRAEVHYGMGAKSALPRISASSLVFSKDGCMRTVALISTTLSHALGRLDVEPERVRRALLRAARRWVVG